MEIPMQELTVLGVFKNSTEVEACYNITAEEWHKESTLKTVFPVFLLQLLLVLFFINLFRFVIKPLKQPPIVAYLFTGMVMGPAMLANLQIAQQYVLPFINVEFLETFAALAVNFHSFLVGYEISLKPIGDGNRKVIGIALSGMLLPISFALAMYVALHGRSDFHVDLRAALVWGVALTASDFPDVADALVSLKLIRTDLGWLALHSSMASDLGTWGLLVLMISMLNPHKYITLFAVVAFILFCVLLVRPGLRWLVKRMEKENFNDSHICYLAAVIMAFGLLTNVLGVHAVVGGFMLGVSMPRDEGTRRIIVDRIDSYAGTIMMPIFFLSVGLRNDLMFMLHNTGWSVVSTVICVCFTAKIVSTLVVVLYHRMPIKEGLSLGLLMNTKGALGLIVINVARDMKVLDNQTYPLMMLSFFVMNCHVAPMVGMLYTPKKQLSKYNRTVEGAIMTPNAQFRILTCVKSARDVYCTIFLLDTLAASVEFPITVIAVNLVEITGRATAMLMVHDQNNPNNTGTKSETDHILDPFEMLGSRKKSVQIQRITAVSHYDCMHEDIMNLALDKCTSFIIIPFRQAVNSEENSEQGEPSLSHVNEYILTNPPCSVGLFLDRGNGLKTRTDSEYDTLEVLNVALLFIGGPDDREALAYASRMSGSESVSLTMLRLLPGKMAMEQMRKSGKNNYPESLRCEPMQKQLDDESIYKFMFNNETTNYVEKLVNDGEETLRAIKELDTKFDLYITGRRQSSMSQLTTGLTSEWCTNPELGVVGDALSSAVFASHASVLVVQQHVTPHHNMRSRSISSDYSPSPWMPLMDDDRRIQQYD